MRAALTALAWRWLEFFLFAGAFALCLAWVVHARVWIFQ